MAQARIQLPYGLHNQSARAPKGACLGILDVAEAPPLTDIETAVRQSLSKPIGMAEPLLSRFRATDTVAIVVSDSFRSTGVDQLLPILLDELHAAGISEQHICFTVSTGTHRGPTVSEQRTILGAMVYERFASRISIHDASDAANLVQLGTTVRGTKVEINRRVHESDRILLTGSVVLHYFGGYGGGRKSMVPGLASVETIASNHAMNLDSSSDRLNPEVRIGALDGNPVAEDMLEASRMTHVDGIINTVLNKSGEIAGVFCGEMDSAHRAACEFAHKLFVTPIREPADLVLAATPQTKNFVQTHKALFNAYQALKPGGRIVLLAPCPEGLGGEPFTKWLRMGGRSEIIRGLRIRSEINGQTALSALEKCPSTFLVTGLSDEDIALLGARRARSLEHALELATAELGEAASYYLMPSAAYTVPSLVG